MDRTEESRQCHGGAKRKAERLVSKHMLVVERTIFPVRDRGHVCGHAAEGNRQIIEVLEFPVRQGQPVQNEADAMTGVKGLRQAKPVAKAESQSTGISALVFLPAKGQILVIDAIVEYGIPID